MADQDKHNKNSDELHEMEQEGIVGELLKEIYSSLDTTIDRKNTAITDLESVKSDVATNNAKVGITTAQASAITANTAKTGITTTQATQLSNLNAGRASGVGTNIKNVTAQITQAVNVNAKAGTATLETSVLLSNGTRYTLSQALTKVNKK
tara:strand:+ start:1544 stop:1996 length:453 start_codon:yes stop_codon:yes gene_type:complete